ncbi:MAG: hypothetical protein HOJ91_13980 [Rhodospirillaceae bacterium]|nr:hypothetical protein [Rhodospirillaceae bacterium]
MFVADCLNVVFPGNIIVIEKIIFIGIAVDKPLMTMGVGVMLFTITTPTES